MSADAFAKKLYLYLLAADCHNPELRRLGWFEFIRFDLPDVTDARVFGAVALHRLLIDGSGQQINHDDRIVYATLAFVRPERGGALPSTVSRELLRLLADAPVVEETVVEWFTRRFP